MVAILVIFLLLFSHSHALFLPSNSSSFPSSLIPDSPPLSNPTLKKILKAIAVKERWDPSGEVRVLELDPISVRVGRSQRYEFYVRVGRMVLMLKFSDGVVSWRKPRRDWGGFGPDFDFGSGFDEDPEPAVRGLELEGPLDLRLAAGDEEEISLLLPALNVTNGGLRRILVGDGITIKVEGTQDVTLFHPHDIGLSFGFKANHDSCQFWPLGLPSCSPLLSVRLVGPAVVVAFRTRNSEAYIETVFHANDTVELLPEKCHSNGHFKKIPSWPFGSLGSKLVLLEKALRNFLGNSLLQGWSARLLKAKITSSNLVSARLLKAKITSSNLVKFRMEVERHITEDDRIWKRVAEWRTKPVVERIWFEIVARVDAGKGWKQMVVRKLTRPIMAVESSPWSNLMSNISFTEIPSIVLPPEALTLDVNW